MSGRLYESGGFTTYKYGVLSGPAIICYSDSLSISMLLNYENGEPAKSQIFFHENGVISLLVTNPKPNTDFVYDNTFYHGYVPYQSYCCEFDEEGCLKGCGYIILFRELEVDLGERVGKWTFYNPDGTVEIVDFSDKNYDKKYQKWL